MFVFIVNKSYRKVHPLVEVTRTFVKRSSIISHIANKHSRQCVSVPMVRAGHKTSPGSHPHSAGLCADICRCQVSSLLHAA